MGELFQVAGNAGTVSAKQTRKGALKVMQDFVDKGRRGGGALPGSQIVNDEPRKLPEAKAKPELDAATPAPADLTSKAEPEAQLRQAAPAAGIATPAPQSEARLGQVVNAVRRAPALPPSSIIRKG